MSVSGAGLTKSPDIAAEKRGRSPTSLRSLTSFTLLLTQHLLADDMYQKFSSTSD